MTFDSGQIRKLEAGTVDHPQRLEALKGDILKGDEFSLDKSICSALSKAIPHGMRHLNSTALEITILRCLGLSVVV